MLDEATIRSTMVPLDLLTTEERLRLINSLLNSTSILTNVDTIPKEHAAEIDQSICALDSIICSAAQSKELSNIPSEILDAIILKVGIAVFKHLASLSINSPVSRRRELISLCVSCYPRASKDVQSRLITVVTGTISDYLTERGLTHFKEESAVTNGVFIAVDLASRLFSNEDCANILEKNGASDLIFGDVMKAMLLAEDSVAGQMLGTLFPVLPMNKKIKDSRLTDIWAVISATYEKHGQKTVQCKDQHEMSERPFLLLCGIADWFFPVTGLPKAAKEIMSTTYFWEILQSGFYHYNALTRKRTMYLLKRILDIVETNKHNMVAAESKKCDPVFWWNTDSKKELSAMWEEFFLMMETLEEKQTHVIKPVLSRLQSLITSTHTRIKGHPLLHSSWLITIFSRVASHESSHINRWGVIETLNVDFALCPLFKQNGTKYLCGPFVKMLTQTNIYHKPPATPLGVCTPLGHAMVKFCSSVACLEDKKLSVLLFGDFIDAVRSEFWSGSSLSYVLYGMAHTPQRKVFDVKVIERIRGLLFNNQSTLETHFRGATTCFLIQAVMNLADPELVGPEDILPIIAMANRGESYLRGTSLWRDIIRWFRQVSASYQRWSSAALCAFVSESINQWLTLDSGDNKDVVRADDCHGIVRFLYLTLDAGLMTDATADHTFQHHISSLINILCVFNAHAYASTRKANRALCFLMSLVKEGELLTGADCIDEAQPAVIKALDSNKQEIIIFISRQLEQIDSLESAEQIDIYLDCLNIYLQYIPQEICSLSVIESMVRWSIRDFNIPPPEQPTISGQLKQYASISVLATFSEFLHKSPVDKRSALIQIQWVSDLLELFKTYTPSTLFEKPRELKAEENRFQTGPAWSKICSEFYRNQWTCLMVLELLGESSPLVSTDCSDTSGYIETCMSCLDLVGSESLVSMFKCLTQILPQEEEHKVILVFEICLRKVFEDPRSRFYWDSFKACIEMIFAPQFLCRPAESKIHRHLTGVADKLFELGEDKQGYANVLISHMLAVFEKSDRNMAFAKNFAPILVKAVIYGPIHSRGRRFTQEVMQFVYDLGDQLSVNQLRKRLDKPDAAVRVMMLTFLSGLSNKNQHHFELVWILLQGLFEEQRELLKVISYRNFPNSHSHRLKHRVFCAMLTVDSFVTQERVPEMFGFLIEVLGIENQSSVRAFIEWLVIRLVHKVHPLRNDIWYMISQGSEKKAGVLCSLLSIVSHLCKLLNDKTELEILLMEALPRVLPRCMAHHFNVRVYAQATLVILWNTAKERKLKAVLQKHNIIDSFMAFTESNKQACKNTYRLLDNFFFHFHPLNDYSFETILHTLPYLTNMSDEEWVEPEMFYIDSEYDVSRCSVPVRNHSDDLRRCNPGTWRVRLESPDYEEEITEGDVQKKMIPWRLMIPQNELEPEYQDDYAQKKQSVASDGLILVTSLIDKIPNLGGLCRTSEIFGVSEFIIGNKRYTVDKAFESLSVTAHKWLPIKEVAPRHLKEYMLGMKEEGYRLVGAEQTANSTCLTDYKFPKKTLLLLGNERQGIPVDIIQLLDVCIEIPQQGVIRSLNVHVSGALLIWEYTRQQLC